MRSAVSKKRAAKRARIWRKNNKVRSNAYFLKLHHDGKTWAMRNPDKVKATRRRRTLRQYGLTPDQWDAMFELQGHCCAICRSPNPKGPNWATDHNHQSDEVRGILCCGCNTGIGQLQDSSTILRLAAEYLESHKG